MLPGEQIGAANDGAPDGLQPSTTWSLIGSSSRSISRWSSWWLWWRMSWRPWKMKVMFNLFITKIMMFVMILMAWHCKFLFLYSRQNKRASILSTNRKRFSKTHISSSWRHLWKNLKPPKKFKTNISTKCSECWTLFQSHLIYFDLISVLVVVLMKTRVPIFFLQIDGPVLV